jgi:hypothetical protein
VNRIKVPCGDSIVHSPEGEVIARRLLNGSDDRSDKGARNRGNDSGHHHDHHHLGVEAGAKIGTASPHAKAPDEEAE